MPTLTSVQRKTHKPATFSYSSPPLHIWVRSARCDTCSLLSACKAVAMIRIPLRSFWLHLLLCSPVIAVLINHTIDDASSLVRYIPNTDDLCVGCAPSDQYDRSQLNNGTVTTYTVNDNVIRAIEMNFTGSAIYIFLAAPSAPTALNQQHQDARRKRTIQYPRVREFIDPRGCTYIPDPAVDENGGQFRLCDIHVYDPEITSASSETSLSITSVTSSISPSETGTPFPAISKKQVPVGAIAGGTIAGVALVLGVLLTELLRRRQMRPRPRTVSPSIEEAPLPPLGGVITTKESTEGRENGVHLASVNERAALGDEVAAALAAQVRTLEAEVQRLMAEREERSTAGSNTSLPRSLSTMKRVYTLTAG
ncbi:hypothetical protein B0H19DRAFT_1080737 [Mycena capillaripes]|nr:hypothetical protein B0H19DRAFT_1080737 [Mycena capillaripes]